MEKHVAERTCVACRKKQSKENFIKVVKVGDEFVVDGDNKTFGRGAYVCKDKKCVDVAVRKKSFDRSFKRRVPAFVYEKLTALICGLDEK